MDTGSAESRDRLRQTIDDEINSLVESTRALRFRRNTLIPISRLPPETLTAIFSFLSPSSWNKEAGQISVAQVCRRWRETALNYSRLWSQINFAKLTTTGAAEMLARARMAPLHLKAVSMNMSETKLVAFEECLGAHISHTCHLSISGRLRTMLKRVESPAPILEFLSLSHTSRQTKSVLIVIPFSLFNGSAPRLTNLELENCGISWNSPLLRGLRTLKIYKPYADPELRPYLEDWLDALNEMSQLETLILQYATPIAPGLRASRAVTLPSLTRFHISASAEDCALALAHLVLPALIWFHVDAKSHGVEEVELVIPYVGRNVLQGTEPLRSILISGEETRAEVVAWTIPEADVKVWDPDTLLSASASARFRFSVTGINWPYGADTAIFDSLLTLLPLNSISTLTAQNHTQLSKEIWLKHAPRWPLLEQARLAPTAVRAFRDMVAEDAPPDGPRLPLLTKLTLIEVALTPLRTFHLLDMLIERVNQRVPLEVLDLSACIACDRAIQLLKEIVVEVQKPPAANRGLQEPEDFNWHGGIGYFNEVEYDDGEGPWYGDIEGDEDEAEYDYGFGIDDGGDESDYMIFE
jgi:F-box-like